MEHLLAKGENLVEAYHNALVNLKTFGEHFPCPDYNTTMIEANMEIMVMKPWEDPMISKCGIYDTESLQQYKMEVEDGILDFMVGIDENVWEYTYHQRIGEQLNWCIEELKRNPWSRRAVIDTRDTKVDANNDDFFINIPPFSLNFNRYRQYSSFIKYKQFFCSFFVLCIL